MHRLAERGRSCFVCAALVVAFGLTGSVPASAKVFASQNQALKDAFPDASRIARDTRILRAKDVDRIEAITHEKLEKKIIVLHTAYKGDEILGYAQIDVHNVRTHPEAFMVVLEPDGNVRSVRILAFHEPLDYLPTDLWYAQFSGKTSGNSFRIGGDLHGVVGATLSARAAANGVRRMLAYFEVLLRPPEGRDSPTPSADSTDDAP